MVTLVEHRYEGSSQSIEDIANFYQVPLSKARFYRHLINAWNDGQEAALDAFGEDTRPYDMVVLSVTYILNVLSGTLSAAEDYNKFQSFVSRIPTNADPIAVAIDLRRLYPELSYERSRHGERSNRREGVTPAGSNFKNYRVRQK